MQIQKIQPSIPAAQAADGKKKKNQRINLTFHLHLCPISYCI